MENTEAGKCPKCGKSYTLDYDPIELDGDSVYYPWTCADCGATGKEVYNLEFVSQELNND